MWNSSWKPIEQQHKYPYPNMSTKMFIYLFFFGAGGAPAAILQMKLLDIHTYVCWRYPASSALLSVIDRVSELHSATVPRLSGCPALKKSKGG